MTGLENKEKLDIEIENIKTVYKLKYLGSILESDGKICCAIQKRMSEDKQVIGMLN